MKQGIDHPHNPHNKARSNPDHPHNKARSHRDHSRTDLGPQFDYNRQDSGPRFECISEHRDLDGTALGDMPSQQPGNRSRMKSRDSSKIFTITDKARIVAATRERKKSLKDSKSIARIAIENSQFETYIPRQVKSTIAQLVDLEDDMAKDDFDYSVFVKKEVRGKSIS